MILMDNNYTFVKVTETGVVVLDSTKGRHNDGEYTYNTAQELIDAYNSAIESDEIMHL